MAELLGFTTQERLRVWLYNSNLSLDPEELNPRLTEWLVEYNFNRPHQSLAYLTPVEYIEKELAKIHSPLLPMYLSQHNTYHYHVRCGIIFMVLTDKRHDSGGPGGGVGTSSLNQNVVPSRKRTVY